MGVIDQDRRPELLGGLDDPGQRRDVAVHREDAVGHDEDESVGAAVRPYIRRLAEDLPEGIDVGVGVDLARRLREPHPVDDRGMVELVRDDEVGLAGDRRDEPGVGGEAGLEGQDGLCALERGEAGFELLVEGHRPGDRADRT
jgi:hypothetical protein